MKRLLCILFLVLLLPFAVTATTPDYTDDTVYPRFVGRLYIPVVGIDVALYRSNKQGVVDRQDSAAYFDLATHPQHMIAADHWTQGFSTLKDVTVGMEAYILHADGTTTQYKCVEVLDGHNTGHIITDREYREVVSKSDLLLYTCIDGWRNVRVVLFDVIEITVEVSANRRCAAHAAKSIPLAPDPADAPAVCAADPVPG